MNATRPLEFVCFFPTSIPTKEGNAYVFLSVDAYSGFVFNTGTESNDNPETILKHIELLTEHHDFKINMYTGFTLVLHKYKEIESKINSSIVPLNGELIFDGQYLNKIMVPVLKNMFQYIEKGL